MTIEDRRIDRLNFPQYQERMMMIRFASSALLILSLMPMVFAGDSRDGQLSPQRRASEILDRFELERRSLDRDFDAAISEATDQYAQRVGELRKKTVEQLDRELQAAIKAGDLDVAISLRRNIQSLKAQPANVTARPLAKTIEGTWRWGNGVTIQNFSDGQTSGNGTWRLIDAESQTYQFDWQKIPADRVKMSASGQILEGTKINQPNARVWAVRIDDEPTQPQIADSASR